MRAFIVALIAWFAVVLAWLLFYPAGHDTLLGCMRLVGRSLACEAQQEAINQVWWKYGTLPSLVVIASGYVGIVIVRLAGARRRRSGRIETAASS